MDKIILAIAFAEPPIDSIVESEEVQSLQQKKEMATKLIVSTIHAVNGEVSGWLNNHLIATLDIENIDKIKKLHKDITNDYELLNSIGVGETVEEAVVAAKRAEKDNAIKVYHPSMDSSHTEPSDVSIDQEDEPISLNLKKSFDEDTKSQLMQVLKVLSQNKNYLEQIKQAQPELHQTIIDLLNSVNAIAKDVKDKKKDQIVDIIDAIKELHNKDLDENEKQIIEQLLSEQNRNTEERKIKNRDAAKAARQKHKRNVQDLEPKAKKYGLDPEFLARLVKGDN